MTAIIEREGDGYVALCPELEDWLRSDVAAAYDALKADPSRAVSVDRVRARLAAEHKKAAAKM